MPSFMKQHSAQDCKKIVELNNCEYVREDMRLREELEIVWDMVRKQEVEER